MSELRRLTLAAVLIAPLALGAACEPELGGLSSDPREARDPQGEAPLRSLSDAEVADALGFATLEIDEQRGIAVRRAIDALGAALTARGIDPAILDGIDDRAVAASLRLPAYEESPAASSAGTYGQQRQGLASPARGSSALRPYYACPALAPTASATDCADLIAPVTAELEDDFGEDPDPDLDPDPEFDANPDLDMEPPDLAEDANLEDPDPGLTDLAGFGDAENPDELEGFDPLLVGDAAAPQRFTNAWADAGALFGARLGAILAEEALRDAGVCDDKPSPKRVASALGREQGAAIVQSLWPRALQQAQSCAINTDQIAEQLRATARASVSTYMQQHAVCKEADLNEINSTLQQAERWRRDGINAGIDRQLELLKQELLQERRKLRCSDELPVAAGAAAPRCDLGASCELVQADGLSDEQPRWQQVLGHCVCCRHRRDSGRLACKGAGPAPLFCGEGADGQPFCQSQAIPLGSPLVLDLDGDGLELTEQPVIFDLLARGDGGQRTTWVGAHDALLARDADGDGAITSGAELFGDNSACDGRRCRDGVEALQAWDAPARGGNGDRWIDARDRVFAELRLWLDANHDGVSSADELHSLPARGVRAIDLRATPLQERRPGGELSARLEVRTDRGPRQAFDVWFALDLRRDQLDHLLPGARR